MRQCPVDDAPDLDARDRFGRAYTGLDVDIKTRLSRRPQEMRCVVQRWGNPVLTIRYRPSPTLIGSRDAAVAWEIDSGFRHQLWQP